MKYVICVIPMSDIYYSYFVNDGRDNANDGTDKDTTN